MGLLCELTSRPTRWDSHNPQEMNDISASWISVDLLSIGKLDLPYIYDEWKLKICIYLLPSGEDMTS